MCTPTEDPIQLSNIWGIDKNVLPMNTESVYSWYLRIIRHLSPMLFSSEKFTLLSGQYTSMTTNYFERKEFTLKYHLIPVSHKEYIKSNSPIYRSYAEVRHRHNLLNLSLTDWLIVNRHCVFSCCDNQQHFRKSAIPLSNVLQCFFFSAPTRIGHVLWEIWNIYSAWVLQSPCCSQRYSVLNNSIQKSRMVLKVSLWNPQATLKPSVCNK